MTAPFASSPWIIWKTDSLCLALCVYSEENEEGGKTF